MKRTIIFYLKTICFLYLLLLSNFIYSQGTCGSGYSFSVSATGTTCVYTFSASYPVSPFVTNVGWRIYSTGAYSKLCDVFSGNNVNRTFCFSGNYDIICTLTFTGGSYCTMTTTNVSISCSGAPVCDPNPGRQDAIPDPFVEITYKCYVSCGTAPAPVEGCMYETGCTPNEYCIVCGYVWIIKILPSAYNCEMFSYWIQYDELIDYPDCGDAVCTSYSLTPGIEYCINNKLGTVIYIIADGNHCCTPDGYQRAIFWSCGATLGDIISVPETIFGHCADYRCPFEEGCTEYAYPIDATSGFPSTGCFTGKKEVINRFNKFNIQEDAQDIIIYNLSGSILFSGKWEFGDLNNLYLQWPDNIGAGLYFIRYKNSPKKTIMLMKLK